MALVKIAFFSNILLLFAFFSLLMEMSNSVDTTKGKEDNQQATSTGMPSSHQATPSSSHRANPSSYHANPSSSLAHIAPSTHAHIAAPSTHAHIAAPSASVRLRGVVIVVHTFVNLENSLFKITNHTSPKLTMTRPAVGGLR